MVYSDYYIPRVISRARHSALRVIDVLVFSKIYKIPSRTSVHLACSTKISKYQ